VKKMKFTKESLQFDGFGSGINCFFKDIFRLNRRRNVFFFLRQFLRGIWLEAKDA